jgi:hypothetical protein
MMDDDAFRQRLAMIREHRDPAGAFLKLAALYRAADPAQRAAIRSEWPFGRRWRPPPDDAVLLPDPAGVSSEQRLRAALLYHVIEGGRIDYRDNLVSIAVLYHAALRLGLDVTALFEEMAGLSGETMAELLRSFLRRSPEDRCLWAFGWEEVSTPAGIRFRWIGNDPDFPRRKPRRLNPFGQIQE